MHELTATQIVETIRSGKATCEDVARSCLERISQREPEVGAWHYPNPEQVIAQPRAFHRSGADGPLRGVPIGHKDIINTADMPTEYGSPIYKGQQPAADAAGVALTQSRPIVMENTVTTEFANQYPGKTRHPFDLTRTPGGSSSGSTVRPASFCGAFGYRLTWGELRHVGVKEAARSLDTLGLIGRKVEDTALFRDVLLGVPPEPINASAPVPRIGIAARISGSRSSQ